MLLRDFVNMKMASADKEASAEGYPLTLNNCKKYKLMRDLKIYGNSYQDGTPTPDAPVDVVSVGEKSVNLFNPHVDDEMTAFYRIGFEKTFNDDNSFNLSATSLRTNYCYVGGDVTYAKNQECFIPQGESVTTFGTWDCIDSTACVGVCFYDNDKALVRQFNALQNGVVGKWTTTKDIYYISYVIRLPNQVAGNAIDINNIKLQLELGDTATPYEPYGKYKIPVTTRGINLFNSNNLTEKSYTFNGVTFTFLDNERIHVKGKLTDATKEAAYTFSLKEGVSVKSGEIYNSFTHNATWFGLTTMFKAVDNNGNFIVNINNASQNATISREGSIKYLVVVIPANNTREWDDVVTIQLIKGKDTRYTPFEPYIEPITTNIFLDEPLRKLGDYADYIDFKENKVVRNVSYTTEFSSNINKYSNSLYGVNNAYRFVVSDLKSIKGIAETNEAPPLSNFLPWGGYVGKDVKTSVGVSEGKFIYFRFDDENNYGIIDVTTFKSWLNENNVVVFYRLETSTEEPLNIEFPKLTAKTSIIEIDTSLAPSDAYGKYIKK